jgi:hypothetical protein
MLSAQYRELHTCQLEGCCDQRLAACISQYRLGGTPVKTTNIVTAEFMLHHIETEAKRRTI